MSNLFCDIAWFLISILNNLSFFLLTSLTSILFLKFSIILPYTALLINLYNTFPALSPCFSAFTFCVFNSTKSFRHCDWLDSSTQLIKLLVFIMKHILFLIKRVRHQFFSNTNMNIIKTSNLYLLTRKYFSFISVLTGAKE